MTKAQHNTTEAADDLDPLDVAVDNILFPAIEAIQQTPRSRGKDLWPNGGKADANLLTIMHIMAVAYLTTDEALASAVAGLDLSELRTLLIDRYPDDDHPAFITPTRPSPIASGRGNTGR